MVAVHESFGDVVQRFLNYGVNIFLNDPTFLGYANNQLTFGHASSLAACAPGYPGAAGGWRTESRLPDRGNQIRI